MTKSKGPSKTEAKATKKAITDSQESKSDTFKNQVQQKLNLGNDSSNSKKNKAQISSNNDTIDSSCKLCSTFLHKRNHQGLRREQVVKLEMDINTEFTKGYENLAQCDCHLIQCG